MSTYSILFKDLDLKIIDCQRAVTQVIEPQITEDIFKYSLETKSKLLRQFIVYRIASFFIEVIESCANKSIKPVFIISEKIITTHLQKNDQFIYTAFRKISTLLMLNLFITNSKIEDIQNILSLNTGDSKELKIKLFQSKPKNLISFAKFYEYIKRYKIHKLQEDIANNFKVKLGLFVA
jgi:hypothetical protein